MGYKATSIFPFLKHKSESGIDEHFLKKFLWYTTSRDSYIQRETKYDGTAFDVASPSYSRLIDYAFLTLLFDSLQLDELHYYFGNIADLDSDVDLLHISDENRALLFLHYGNKSALFSFLDKLRNSLAHGTFNDANDRFLMIGQNRASASSLYNYFLQIRLENSSMLSQTNLGLPDMNTPSLLSWFAGYAKRICGQIYGGSWKVKVDNSFDLVKGKNVALFDQLRQRYSNDDCRETVIFVPIASNLSLNKLFFYDYQVQIVTTNKIFEYLHLPVAIHYWKAQKQ